MEDQRIRGACYFMEKKTNKHVYAWYCIRNADDSFHQEGIIRLGERQKILIDILGNKFNTIKVIKMVRSYAIKEFSSRHLVYLKQILLKTLKDNLKVVNCNNV